jgi:hypothetical protein
MPSTPSSPATPSLRRRSRPSPLDASNTSPSPYASNETTYSRRSSRTSFSSLPKYSPVTPRAPYLRRTASGSVSISTEAEEQGVNGMDSLADELADVWGEDAADSDADMGFVQGLLSDGSTEPASLGSGPEQSISMGGTHNFGMGIPLQPPSPVRQHSKRLSKSNLLSPQPNGRPHPPPRHQRTESNYDGSDYGPDSDPEDLSPALLRRISDIESLTRISTHADDAVFGEKGGIISRTTAGLKDLGPQASIENRATRLVTAYTSMAMHRAHKAKELRSQSHGLLFAPQAYGMGAPPPPLGEEVLDELLGSVEELMDTLPVGSVGGLSPLLSLQVLVNNTAELVYALRSLADVLAESKVVAAAAGRRLKGVRELVVEIRNEEELQEEGIRWIEAGDWEGRLARREGARVCGEVVSGFEKFCEGWRERLIGLAELEGGGGMEVGA